MTVKVKGTDREIAEASVLMMTLGNQLGSDVQVSGYETAPRRAGGAVVTER